jgi:hypothetical protein
MMTVQRFCSWCSVLLSVVALNARAQGGNVDLAPGFWPDPIGLRYYSGGNHEASRYGGNCVGRIASVPDHIITVTEPLDYLRIYVESITDTTLIVEQRSTGEVVCNDDADDLNPALEWEFVPVDIYHVYVGNYHENDGLSEYTLYITEFAP